MGNKINSNGLRIGVNRGWNSIWYGNSRVYKDMLHQDIIIRKLVTDKLNIAGLETVVIKRSENNVEVEVYVARPGVAIGRGGTGLDSLKDQLKKIAKKPVEIKISEVKKPDLSARIVARAIADGVEKRLPLKPLMENSKNKAMLAGARGVKIWVSGRIGGAKQARSVKVSEGQVPVQKIRALIDYAEERASTKDLGIYGIKVWIFKPDEKK